MEENEKEEKEAEQQQRYILAEEMGSLTWTRDIYTCIVRIYINGPNNNSPLSNLILQQPKSKTIYLQVRREDSYYRYFFCKNQ